MQNQQPLDPSIIDSAPLDEPDVILSTAQIAVLENQFFELQTALAEARAEAERLKGKKTVEQVRAEMMQPYANKVFWFVAGYCLVVAVLLVLAGFGAITGFSLSDTILGIIAGSTAISVIGLIGMVLGGLFGGKRTEP